MPALDTPRLRLIPISLEAIEAVLDHDKPRAERVVGASFPPGWPNDPLLDVGFPYSRAAIRAAPAIRLWGDSLILLRDEPRVVGSVVFHGHPSDGVAEVGYSIEDRSRGNSAKPLNDAVKRCVLGQWPVSSEPVISGQDPTQVRFAQHHDVLQAFFAD